MLKLNIFYERRTVMKNFCFVIVLILFAFSVLPSFAQNDQLDKSPWALVTDTAYTLDQGKWRLSALGWIAYGATDYFLIGTNFWGDIAQSLNANAKLRVVKEDQSWPEISVVWQYYYNSVKSTTEMSDVGIYGTKKIMEKTTLYGGISRVPTTALLTTAFKLEATNNNPIPHIGVAFRNDPKWRSFVEIYSGVSKTTSSITFVGGAGGVEWTPWDPTFLLKLGGYFPGNVKNLTFVPVVDLHWIF
jgi:hypothetical protein